MGKTQKAALGAKECKELTRYIDYLVMTKAGGASAQHLNGYRMDAMRGELMQCLTYLANNYDPEKIPEFTPYAKAILKRYSRSAFCKQMRSQSVRKEGAFGYASLDAPLESSDDESEASLLDCLPDQAEFGRGFLGERLRRFYRVVEMLPPHDGIILDTMADCNLNQRLTALRLGVTPRVLGRMLRHAYARFRAIWRTLD